MMKCRVRLLPSCLLLAFAAAPTVAQPPDPRLSRRDPEPSVPGRGAAGRRVDPPARAATPAAGRRRTIDFVLPRGGVISGAGIRQRVQGLPQPTELTDGQTRTLTLKLSTLPH